MFYTQPSNRQNISKKKKISTSVIEELRTKMNHIKIQLLDYQNRNQTLRKEMLMAKQVVNTELLGQTDADFDKLLHQASTSEFPGRREKILLLKDKLNHLQNRIKEIEKGDHDEPTEKPQGSPKQKRFVDPQTTKNKKIIDKEVQYLLERSCQIKRKIEQWKKRSLEIEKEEEILRLELNRLLEKSKEDKQIHASYRAVEKELRARQNDKLDLQSKLRVEKTRNEQLENELAVFRNDLSTIKTTSDEKSLIDALKSQNDYLHDLLERQRLILEKDNWRYKEDLREIQMKHAGNKNTLDHLRDIMEQQKLDCQHMQEATQRKQETRSDNEESEEFSAGTVNPTELNSQHAESASAPSAENNVQNEEGGPEEGGIDGEVSALTEECQMYKDLFWSVRGEKEQLIRTVLSNDKKVKGWIDQLLQTRSLYSQKCAKNRDLEETCKILENPSKKKSSSTDSCPSFTDEMIRKGDVLMEEYQLLRSLWEMLMPDIGNSLKVLMTSIECRTKIFENDVINLDEPTDNSPTEPEPSPPLQEVSA